MTHNKNEISAWVNHDDTLFVSILADFMLEHKNLYKFDVCEDVLCVVKL